MPAAAIPLLFLPAATVAVSMALESWGESAADLGMLYVWVVLYAAYFLSPGRPASSWGSSRSATASCSRASTPVTRRSRAGA